MSSSDSKRPVNEFSMCEQSPFETFFMQCLNFCIVN